MQIKIKYWWSEDRKSFCITTNDGVNEATVSLTPEEASLLSMNAIDQVEHEKTCSTCRYFDQPKPAETHGWCQYAHLGANVRDWTNSPMKPDGSCPKHARIWAGYTGEWI